MLPTKKQLMEHLEDKMTNQDIAKIYGVTFQKIIQLVKKYELHPNELRRVDKFIVYEHLLDGSVCYVGSGVWYRMRRSSTRRNIEHQQLMEQGFIEYKIVAEFDDRDSAKDYEDKLIKRYRSLGQSKFNFKYAGVRDEITKRGYSSTRPRRSKNQSIEVWKNGQYYGTYNYIIDFAREIADQPEKLLSGISTMINKNWRPQKGPLARFVIKNKSVD
ncbi:hypothetical protein ACIQAA_27115 [Neobacillus sp. NPDC093182]|uniref:hypothetical protein n=1 Tax=Neobacillus sp. NPDC093182 TaxID=3364297 RepID=UPI00382238D2